MRAGVMTVSAPAASQNMRKALNHLRSTDPTLARIIDAVGPYRIQYNDPVFASLVRSIVYQQLSGKVASVIFTRLEAAAGTPIRPAAILRLSEDQMRAVGLSKQKSLYISDLAAKSRSIQFPRLPLMTDEQVIERLTQVKGVGVWTAHMFLMFSLRRPDVLPVGDLGIRMAIRRAWEMDELPTPKQVEEIGAAWRPWCSVASWYLWRSLELKNGSPDGQPKGL
jgi:DNA-3-methyladenine glycosylase II